MKYNQGINPIGKYFVCFIQKMVQCCTDDAMMQSSNCISWILNQCRSEDCYFYILVLEHDPLYMNISSLQT